MLSNKVIGSGKKKIQISRRGEGKYYAGCGTINVPSTINNNNASGGNYIFGGPLTGDFFLLDSSGYAFQIVITDGVGVERAEILGTNANAQGYPPGTIVPFASPLVPTSLTKSLFCADGYFRLININDGLAPTYQFHWIDAYQGFLRIEDPAGIILPNATPIPYTGGIPYQGPNYWFTDGLFYLRDNYYNTWRIPYIVSDSNHEYPRIALA